MLHEGDESQRGKKQGRRGWGKGLPVIFLAQVTTAHGCKRILSLRTSTGILSPTWNHQKQAGKRRFDYVVN